MQIRIMYADDEDKKKRFKKTIITNPGITTHRLFDVMGVNHRTGQKLLKEMVASSQIHYVRGRTGSIMYYAN